MKALSYLQYMQLPDDSRIDYIKYLYENKYLEFIGLNQIYNQPFKPELITEYFKGWQKVSAVHYCNKDLAIETNIDKIDEQGNKCYSIYRTDRFIYLYNYQFYPRTLDDFINDCQRAGIELEWRQK